MVLNLKQGKIYVKQKIEKKKKKNEREKKILPAFWARPIGPDTHFQQPTLPHPLDPSAPVTHCRARPTPHPHLLRASSHPPVHASPCHRYQVVPRRQVSSSCRNPVTDLGSLSFLWVRNRNRKGFLALVDGIRGGVYIYACRTIIWPLDGIRG